jgi:hypothetical protein
MTKTFLTKTKDMYFFFVHLPSSEIINKRGLFIDKVFSIQ